MAEDMVGKILNNRYQISERIGIGGMAEVYRAQDNVLGRTVAVKVMLPQYAADPAFTQRFRQEAASAANLQSPFIVNVYDWGQDQGVYYIVMEYVRGSDLKTAIQQRGAINQRKVAEIGSQVCQALSVAHGMDIVHRDIKPQNIMVQPDGNVKVMDFGIARAKNSVNARTSSVLGTAHYISPEQAQGKELTPASDIYSLGVALYEAATGRLPFDGPDAISVAMQQVKEEPPLPSEINPNIDPGLEAIIMKAMSKDPYRRFSTAKDMRLALNDYLSGRQVLLGEGFTSAQTQIIGTTPLAAGGALAAGAAATAVMPAMGGETAQPRSYYHEAAKDEEQERKKKRMAAIAAAIVAAILVLIVGVLVFGRGDSGEKVEVPDLAGLTESEAIASIEEAGFEVGTIDRKSNSDVEADHVVSQNPKAGIEKPKGSKIDLVISTGVGEVEVPDLAGMTADEAKKALTAAGLKFSEGTGEHSDDVEKGHVVRQDIAAGTKVAKDTTVTYILSLGEEGEKVPNVVGKSEGEAITVLNNAGFYVNTEYRESDSVAQGLVISQSPEADSSLKKDGTVLIVVSTGKAVVNHSVNVTYSEGGQVSASTNSVEDGGSVTVSIVPAAGYTVASCTGIEGVPPTGGTFTVSNVTADLYVQVNFAAVTTP